MLRGIRRNGFPYMGSLFLVFKQGTKIPFPQLFPNPVVKKNGPGRRGRSLAIQETQIVNKPAAADD
ncbi:hypothetical protein D3C73_1638520 [compost metagenome]